MSSQSEVREQFNEPFVRIQDAFKDLKTLSEYYPHPKLVPRVLEVWETIAEFRIEVEKEIDT